MKLFIQLATIALCAFVSTSRAQPSDPPPEGSRERLSFQNQPGLRTRSDREALRGLLALPPEERQERLKSFLTERLERAERAKTSLSKAIDALDRGAGLDEIVALIPQDLRDSRGGGGAGGSPTHAGPRPGEDANIDELGPVPMPGQPRSGDGGPPPSTSDRPVTEEDRAAVQEFLISAAPQLAVMMDELRDKNPERADVKVRETLNRIGWLMDVRKSDRALYELRLQDIRHGREAFDAARSLARYDRTHEGPESSERQVLVAKLRGELAEQYRVRGELLQSDIQRLEGDLSKRRADLARRSDGQESTITRMADKLRDRAREWMSRHPRDQGGPPGRSRMQGGSEPPPRD